MPDLADLYPGFASKWLDTAAGRIFARTGGEGPPLLLLHGYPQTNVMWHRLAPALAQRFSLIIPDLPGYGWSDAPPSDAEHAPYTKRAMANAMIEVTEALGHARFRSPAMTAAAASPIGWRSIIPGGSKSSPCSTSCRPG
jgi:haloacetate dehalogenase